MEFTETAHALIIGVGDYTHSLFRDLPATEADANAISDVLTDANRCGYAKSNVEVLTGEKATAPNIRESLKNLSHKTDSQSTVFIFFSGHGGRRKFENGSYQAYICPREADPYKLNETTISGEEFSNLLAEVPAQKMVVILDACHAGGSANLKSVGEIPLWKSGLPDHYYDQLSRGSGRIVIASSKEDQSSYVRPDGKFSIFTWHLRDALQGSAGIRKDGLIHVLDVFHYVNEKVQADQPKQVPILKAKDLDLNFVLALDRGGKVAGNLSPETTATVQDETDIQMAWTNALLQCRSIRDPGTRESIIEKLPPEIRVRIHRRDTTQAHVDEIVSACMAFDGGLPRLVKILRFFEGPSKCMKLIEELLK